jgi:hypothetical protein
MDQCRGIFGLGRVKEVIYTGQSYFGQELGGQVYKLHYLASVGDYPGKLTIYILYDERGVQILRFELFKGL